MKSRTQKLTNEVYYQAQTSFRTVDQLAEEANHLKDLKMLFGKYVPQNNLVHFPSQRGVGKSWLCMQICMAVSGEWDSFLGEPINYHGNTLIVNHELSPNTMLRRSQRLKASLSQPMSDRYKCFVYTTRAGLNVELSSIIGYVERYKPVLIVIDNLRMAFTETDVNNNKEATRIMNMLLALCDTSGAAVIINGTINVTSTDGNNKFSNCMKDITVYG